MMCTNDDLRNEMRLLRAEIVTLTARITAVEDRMEASVLTRQDVLAAIDEADVLTREQFDEQLLHTLSEAGARLRRGVKHALYGTAGFLGIIVAIITALQHIWGVFS